MKRPTKKGITIFAVVAGVLGVITTVIRFFMRNEKKVIVHNGKKKLLYPQDLLLEKTLLKLIPDFVKPVHISVLRIVLTPLAALLIANGQNLWIPLIVYLFVSFTDMVDGALARTRDQITDIGKMIDPVADKLLFIFSTLFLLPQFGATWLLYLMVGMELFNIIFAGHVYQKGVDIAANWFGKIKMNLQVLGVVLFLIAKYQNLVQFVDYGTYILLAAVLFHICSLLSFVYQRYINR